MSAVRLRAGQAELALDPERGGRIASLLVSGRELVVGAPDEADRTLFWGWFLMAPWPGRLERGVLDWEGRRHVLRPTLGPHAIHGVTWDRPWTVLSAGRDEARLERRLEPPDWPLGGLVRQRIRLGPDELRLEAEVVAGERSMPAGLGWHPWFVRPDDGPRLRVDADEVLETDELIPTGRVLPVAGPTDLRAGPLVGDRALDHTYLGVRGPVEATWPNLGLRVEGGPTVGSVHVHTRPGAFCVEPQTCWPNALGGRLRGVAGTGLAVLEPHGLLAATMSVAW